MESLLTTIADYLWTQSCQIALLVVAVGLASWALRNRSAHVRYLLWLLVLAKCLTPPIVQVPLAVLPYKAPPVTTPIISTAPSQEDIAQRPVEEGSPLTPASAVPESLHLTTRQWLAVGWLAGVAVFASIALTKAARTILWLRRERRVLPRTSGDSFDEIFRSLGVKRLPRLWLIEGVGQPFVWGVLRGDIYLPNRFGGIDDDEHRRHILAHEIGHVLRFDAAVNILQIIAQGIFWFHPLLWWANQRIRREREKCCDEMAIAHLGARPKDYSSAIVRTLIQAQESTRPVPSLAVAGPVKNIEERIRTMLRPGKRFHTRPSLAVATAVVLVALVAVPTTVVLTAGGQAQPTSQSADKPVADSGKPEQPRYAARIFNSQVACQVFYGQESSPDGWTWPGRTPSAAPLEIPACQIWGIVLFDPVDDWDLLIKEIRQNRIPALRLDKATDSDLRHLADCAGLEYLDLRFNSRGVTDAGLAHLTGLKGLWGLELYSARITDAGLVHLKDLTRLQVLDLRDTQITDAGLVHLKRLTQLQVLGLGGTRITDAGLERLKGLTELRDLRLWGTKITDAGMEHVKALPRLQKLRLGGTPITDAGFGQLKGLTGLQELGLSGTRITDAGLEQIRGLTGLRFLGPPTKITDGGLAYLKDLTGLRTLDLSGFKITDAGLVHLRGLTGLMELRLDNTGVTDVGLENLKNLVRLQTLHLERTPVTDEGLAHLKGLTELTELWLSHTGITGSGLEHLKGLPRLHTLILERTSMTDAGSEHLKGLSALQNLDLQDTSITGVGLRLPSRLQQISLTNTKITDAGLAGLRDLTELQDLSLGGTQITNAGLEDLKRLSSLRWLSLAGTQITDAGLEHLKGLTTLFELWLGETQITDAGLEHLKSLPTLRRLELVRTQVTDAGVEQLKRSLPRLRVER